MPIFLPETQPTNTEAENENSKEQITSPPSNLEKISVCLINVMLFFVYYAFVLMDVEFFVNSLDTIGVLWISLLLTTILTIPLMNHVYFSFRSRPSLTNLIIYKLAYIHLIITSIIYILLGISVFIPLIGWAFAIIVTTFNAVVIPTALMSKLSECGAGIGCVPPFVELGITAFILGLIALISLTNLKRSPKMIYVWYGLSGFAFLTAISNFLIDPINPSVHRAIYNVDPTTNPILASSYFLATLLIHHEAWSKKS